MKKTCKQVVIITGATSGIGKAAAEEYLQKGYAVYCFARRILPDFNCISVDVTDRAALEAACKTVYDAEGRIDVLVNNAGFGISGAIEDTSSDAAHKIFEVNFFGVMNAVQAVLPYMRAQKSGCIVNVSSAAAPLAIPFQAFYSATKAAVSSFTEALRLEVKPFGIRVTAILPGDVQTSFTDAREKKPLTGSAYEERTARSVEKMERDERSGMPASLIGKQIVKLSQKRNPPVYKVGGAIYAVLVFLAKILPKRTVSYLVGKLYG